MQALPLENTIREKMPLLRQIQAVSEAERCFFCFEPPCVSACPTSIDIPLFIKKIATKNNLGAAKTIFEANILGYSCAKACPVEVLCEGACVYHHRDEPPIQIGRLQAFATSEGLRLSSPQELLGEVKAATGKKIAFIGAGPASIAAAVLLRLEGHQTVLFEAKKFIGGLNSCGIAPYKLKYHEAKNELSWLSALGLEFKLGEYIDEQAAALEQEYDAIFLGLGLGADKRAEGLTAPVLGVYGACDLIENIKTNADFSLGSTQHAHIIGGGNTALDLAQELKLLGVKEVSLHYRRDEASMSGYSHELFAARKLGVYLYCNSAFQELVHDGTKLVGFTTQDNKFFTCDLIAFAIGQSGSTELAPKFSHVRIDEKKRICVDSTNFRTDNPKIWAAGDCVNGGKEVVNAVAEAKIAAASMINYLRD
jgi:glutamate synthase (NADPH/NADH) small chain